MAVTGYDSPTDIPGTEDLRELALDMRWSWDHGADELWNQIDPELWELTRSPWVILQTAAATKLEELCRNPAFCEKARGLTRQQRESRQAVAWFQQAYPAASFSGVAYFSLEFLLTEALPIYSGGLGNVAGDQLKAASDLGVPVIGVGLLYQQGYFRQVLDAEGGQTALYPYNDPGQLPVTPVRDASGEWVRLKYRLPGFEIWIRAWQARVGRTILYLLDSNDPANPPVVRGITSELYGGGSELRLQQEMVLGIGGWRLLRTLGLHPEVCHLNEGHAALAVLERARWFMEEQGQPFRVALAVTRGGNLFTTHTAVPAGFDRFDPGLMRLYLSAYAEQLGIGFNDLMALGRQHPDDADEPFNMAYLAMRGSRAVNAVSRLHGDVSRRLFASLFPRWPEAEVPLGSVTNGVHVPTWDSAAADELCTKTCGQGLWRRPVESVEVDLRGVPDTAFWNLRSANRKQLIGWTRKRLARQLAASGATSEELSRAQHIFAPDVLTLGFARRFATYKRPNLLLHDSARLTRLLTNPRYPVQLIIAGKAHPQDEPGKAMVREWVQFTRRPEIQGHVAFISDYDMLVAEQLVQGVDVWINTPRRPWEASGTSGMKVLVNGGLNLSELDGWWAEAYSPAVGWALGDGKEHGDDPAWDAQEAEALYTLLEREVVPAFYSRDPDGIPAAWVARMRESMARLTPQFSTNRVVREYTERYYLPAAEAYRHRAADRGATGAALVQWQAAVSEHWCTAHFGHVQIDTADGQHRFEVHVYLGDLDSAAVSVELYAEGGNGAGAIRHAMERARPLTGAANAYVYTAQLTDGRPANDYTPRLIPHHPDAIVPLEAAQILWQR
jgi:starch phosphorylase